MGPGDLVAIFGIVACFGLPVAITSLVLRHKQRMAEFARSRVTDTASSSEIAQMREEIAQLRDTTTKYDISVEHSMYDLSERLASFELQARREASTPPAGSSARASYSSAETQPERVQNATTR